MKTMTRRTFLKTTGTLVAAAGIAGALSGCDAVDKAIDDAINNAMDKNNVAGVTHKRVGVTWNMGSLNRKNGVADADGTWKEGPFDVAILSIDISSLSSQEYDLKAENFTLKVDGVQASMLSFEEAKSYVYKNESGKYDLLLGENGTAHIGAGDIESRSINGCVVFRLNNAPALEKWSSMELSINFGPGSYNFTATPKEGYPDRAEIKANR